MTTKMYKFQSRETGEVFEVGLTIEEAQERLRKAEQYDKVCGEYTTDFYEIVEDEQ